MNFTSWWFIAVTLFTFLPQDLHHISLSSLMHAPNIYLMQSTWSKVFLWMIDEKFATCKNLSNANFLPLKSCQGMGTQAVPEVQFLFLELACKARSRATQNLLFPHAFINKIAAYAIFLGPEEVGMLHKHLSTGVIHFLYVLYLNFHLYQSLQFYATLDVEVDSSSSDLAQVIY